jgi:hypothetical protein
MTPAAAGGAPGGAGWQSSAAFAELLDLVRGADELFLSGDRAVVEEIAVAEGYRWLLQLLTVAQEIYVAGDSARPTMVPITSPTMKWGGDNSDAFYHYAAIDPRRTYRLSGAVGEAAYLSATVYGGPDDGRWSTRIVGIRNDRDLDIAADGSFELVLSPDEHPGDWMHLDDDAVALVTRDYLVDPVRGRRCTWSISTDDPAPPPRHTDADTARRLRATTAFLRELLGIFPLAVDPAKANTVDEPYAQPPVTYGWAAGDAAYAMGTFDLAPDEALVVEGVSPACAFWNVCLWNPFLQTFDYRYEQVTLNGGQVALEPDGSWQLVVAHDDPGVANWLSTAGHRAGLLWFRWFLAEHVPTRPTTRVVALGALRSGRG